MSYPPENVDIVSLPFLENEFLVLAARTHWAVGQPLTLEELADEPFLLREVGSGSRHVIDQHMQVTGVQLKVRLSLSSNEAIRELVASGMGLAVLSRHALGDSLERGQLIMLDVKGFPLTQPWSVVHLRSKVLSLPAQAFLDELLQTGHSGLSRTVKESPASRTAHPPSDAGEQLEGVDTTLFDTGSLPVDVRITK